MRSKTQLTVNDYVLGTKYSDGDPQDPWYVGFYNSTTKNRFILINELRKNIRPSGFRRAEKISKIRGEFILNNKKNIENNNRSLWYWKRCRISTK